MICCKILAMSYLFYPLDKPEAALYSNYLSLLTEPCNNL